MKLFYHLFGYLFFGMVVLVGTDEYLSFRTEVSLFESDMLTSTMHNGRTIAAMFAHTWRESGEKQAKSLLEDASQEDGITVRWVRIDDTILDSQMLRQEEREAFAKLTAGEGVSLIRLDSDRERRLYTYIPAEVGKASSGAVEIRQTLKPLKNFSEKMVARALWISVVLVSVCGLILYVFIHRNVRLPLSRLVERARRIGSGDLAIDQDFVGHYEMGDMARTLNELCSSLAIAKEKIKFEYDARLKTLDQLRHTERLSTFGLIAAGIAHEIGTPLNVVDGRAKMIINDRLPPEDITECATIIKIQAERMTVIIRQLLDFTRRPKQHIAEENILFLFKQLFQLLSPMASRQRVTFSLHRDGDAEVLIRVDGAQMQQVLINLLMNGIQAMPDGGNIAVHITNEMVSAAEAIDRKPSSHMKIRIVDEGTGINQEDLENIFTPFYTTKTVGTGTGLGLSIAHGIIEEHGGWIEVESSARSGACFSIYLPMNERVR